MGQEIVYCNVCGDRILESHFKKGKAVTVQKKNYCPKCAKNVVKASQKMEGTPQSSPEQTSPRKFETRRIPLAEKRNVRPMKLPIPMPFIVAIGIGVLVVILVLVVVMRGR